MLRFALTLHRVFCEGNLVDICVILMIWVLTAWSFSSMMNGENEDSELSVLAKGSAAFIIRSRILFLDFPLLDIISA